MATPDIQTFNKYYGNGETTEFSVGFTYSKQEFVAVYIRRAGFEQVKVDKKDFEFVNDKTIRFPSLRSSEDVLRDGDIITIQRETPVASDYVFSNQKRLFPEDVMDADDLAFEILQEQLRELGRAIVVDPTSEVQPKVLLEKVDLVYNRIDDIETVSRNIDSVDNVSKNIDVVSDVSAIKEEVKDVSDNMSAVLGVHANEENINVVKENDAGIRLVAGNIDAVLDASNQAESARVGAESARLSAEAAASSAAISNPPPLLTHSWEDHILNDIRYLRADTFSWHNGEFYKAAYEHLVEDFVSAEPKTEIVGSQTITYALSEDGHKIVLPDLEAAVQAVYEEAGVAWYYILDTDNKRFKLPRTKYGFVGLRDSVGKYVPESLPNITGSWHSEIYAYESSGAITRNYGGTSKKAVQTSQNTNYDGFSFNASRSSSTYQDNAPVQQRATQMYLYFYVGNYTRSSVEQTAGVTTEVLNGKVDLDLSNINPSSAAKETIVGWGMPDYGSGISKTKGVIYQAEHDGFVYIKGAQTSTEKASLVLEIGFEPDLSDAFNLVQFYTSPNTTFESSSFTPIPKGTYYRAKEKSYATTIIFYPLKGTV